MRLNDIPAAPAALDGSETLLGLKAGAAALLPFAQPPTFGIRAVLMGDSITGYNTYASSQGGAGYYPNGAGSTEVDHGQSGFFTAFNQLSGQKLHLDPALNRGISGNTTAQMAARYDTDIASSYAAFDWLFLMGGTNDPPAAVAKETTLANLQVMALKALANRKSVALFTILPRASLAWSGATGTNITAYTRAILWVNAQLRLWARQVGASGRLVLVDAWQDWADPASTQTTPGNGYTLAAGVSSDGLHPSGYGAYLIGRRITDALGPFLPPRPLAGMGAIDLFDATQNPGGNALSNPIFATATGGTNSASSVTASGGVPGNWTVAQSVGSGSVTASEVVYSTLAAPAAAYGARQGSAGQFAVNIASGKSAAGSNSYSNTVSLRGGNINTTGFLATGGVYQATAKVKLSGLAGFCGADLMAYVSPDGTHSYFRHDGALNITGASSWGQDDQTLTLLTPPLTYPDTASGSGFAWLQLSLYFDARTAAAMGTAVISDMQYRRIG